MSWEAADAVGGKRDALKFLTEEALSFFRRFSAQGDNLSLTELDALQDMRAKLTGGIVLAEQLIISATINALSEQGSPQVYSAARKILVDIQGLLKGLLTVPNAGQNILRIRKLLVKIKYLLPREQTDYENFAKLLAKVEKRITAGLADIQTIIQTQRDFAVLAFLGNNLFSEELSGETTADKQLAGLRSQLLPRFIQIMGLLVGRLNDLDENLNGRTYSEKENKMVALAYESMSASLKKISIR
ncbi:MAG: hypothetical protein LBD99_03805 [Candidatus Margulisbacteria bacterium]|jgi:hypothetical protein|nr:hypothetical protein [Candidatus Margulisiibacteriota bacterium]